MTDPGFSPKERVWVPMEVRDAAGSLVLDRKSGKCSMRPEDEGGTVRRACGGRKGSP